MASNEEGSPAKNLVPSINETYQVISENSDYCVRCKESITKCKCITIKNVVNGDGNDHSEYYATCKQAWYYYLDTTSLFTYSTSLHLSHNTFCFSNWRCTNTNSTC